MDQEPGATKKAKERRHIIIRADVCFVIVTIVFTVVCIGFGVMLRKSQDLARENENRIADIQDSRIQSCTQIYNGIKLVFEPFFPPIPRTAQQQESITKFNTTISHLTRVCVNRIKTDINNPPKKEPTTSTIETP